MMLEKLEWHEPREKIWGFHIHQEIDENDLGKALVVQMHCAEFLKNHTIPIDEDDTMAPGYGPHLEYVWDLRVESAEINVLEKMGLSLAYMAINRCGMSAYIHPLMQDHTLPMKETLEFEGTHNQPNIVWFGQAVKQHQAFFFNPPLDKNDDLIDTRAPRILSKEKTAEFLSQGKKELAQFPFKDPADVIIRGFHLHMDYTLAESEVALLIFDHFLSFLLKERLRPTSTRIYEPHENGPHIKGGWEVKFETRDKAILEKIGVAVGWLMCNRQGLSVFMHPVTWEKGDVHEELYAHQHYAVFIGTPPELDLTFFSNQLSNENELEYSL